MTVEEYFNLCETFDWFYANADDNRVYTEGQRGYNELRGLAKSNEDFARIFIEWNSYVHSGPLFGTPKLEKPSL